MKFLSPYKTFVFDLDGTLCNNIEGISNGIRYSLQKSGRKDIPTNLNHWIGPPLHQLFHKYYNMEEGEVLQAVEWYRDYYRSTGIFENKLYPGIEQVLTAASAYGELFVLTNKPLVFAESILNHFHIAHYFKDIAGIDVTIKNHEKTAVAYTYLIPRHNISPKDTLMIGDTVHDIFCARKFNWSVISVTYGFGEKQELVEAGPDVMVHSVNELLEIFKH